MILKSMYLLNVRLLPATGRNGANSCRLCSNSPTFKFAFPTVSSTSGPTRSLYIARPTSVLPSRTQPFRYRSLRLFHTSPLTTSQFPSPPPLPEKQKKRSLLDTFNRRENITNIPNLLTVSRLIAAPAIGYFIIHDQHLLAASLLAYASVTDFIDGYIARKYDMKTVIGTVLDPMADKILMTILTVSLMWKGALPLWLGSIILGRDVGMGLAAFYFRWISLPPPKTLTRYFDFSLPSIEVKPTTISKVNTALQLGLLGALTVHPLLKGDYDTALTLYQYIVATTTIWSGASYVYTKDALRIIPKGNEEEKGDVKAKL